MLEQTKSSVFKNGKKKNHLHLLGLDRNAELTPKERHFKM